MWAFLGSDCMFFGSLIATYLVYQGKSVRGPEPIDVFSIPTTSVSTFVLLMSSMSMVLAYAALTRGSLKGFRIWILSTAILGMTFLAFQTFEFRDFANHEAIVKCADEAAIAELTAKLSPAKVTELGNQCDEGAEEAEVSFGVTPRTNLFGTTFFTLTGFHGAHVNPWRCMAPLPILLLVQTGRRHAGEEPGRRPGRAVLALRRYRLDHHLHRRIPVWRV